MYDVTSRFVRSCMLFGCSWESSCPYYQITPWRHSHPHFRHSCVRQSLCSCKHAKSGLTSWLIGALRICLLTTNKLAVRVGWNEFIYDKKWDHIGLLIKFMIHRWVTWFLRLLYWCYFNGIFNSCHSDRVRCPEIEPFLHGFEDKKSSF